MNSNFDSVNAKITPDGYGIYIVEFTGDINSENPVLTTKETYSEIQAIFTQYNFVLGFAVMPEYNMSAYMGILDGNTFYKWYLNNNSQWITAFSIWTADGENSWRVLQKDFPQWSEEQIRNIAGHGTATRPIGDIRVSATTGLSYANIALRNVKDTPIENISSIIPDIYIKPTIDRAFYNNAGKLIGYTKIPGDTSAIEYKFEYNYGDTEISITPTISSIPANTDILVHMDYFLLG